MLLSIAVYEDTFEKIKFKVEREEKARGKLYPNFMTMTIRSLVSLVPRPIPSF